MPLLTNGEIREMLSRSVPRLVKRDAPGQDTEQAIQTKQTLRQQASEALKKLSQ